MNGQLENEDPFPKPIMKALRESRARISAPMSFERMWDRVLTPEDRNRLGDNMENAFFSEGTVNSWMRLRGVSEVRAIVDVAHGLNLLSAPDRIWLLRETGETPSTIEEAIDAAVKSVDLVLVERPRTLYWRGSLVDVDWYRKSAPWTFVVTLAERAKLGAGVDRTDFGDGVQASYVSKAKSRLSELPNFPLDLVDLIVPCGRGTQKLDLPGQSVRIFPADEDLGFFGGNANL